MIVNEYIEKVLYKLALKAYKKGEVPVSCVVIHNNKIISKAYNLRESRNDIMAHAEVLAIRSAARKLKNWNLSDCDLYVTLKPCSMCECVIKQSRIKNVYYYLDNLDFKREYNKTNFDFLQNSDFSSSYQHLFSSFFQNKR